MTTRNTKVWSTLFVAVVVSMGFFLLDGCKKSEDTSAQNAQQEMHNHEGHDHEGHAPMAMEAEPAEETAIEQKTCPVMGGAINKELFVEYKGKKVYFCCAGCEEQFMKEPEKYVAKLPQFE